MAITLSSDQAARVRESIKRFCDEHLDQEVGDLKAQLFLDYCLREIGPTIYNAAIADAQKYFEGKVLDLEGACHEAEFQFWKR